MFQKEIIPSVNVNDLMRYNADFKKDILLGQFFFSPSKIPT